MSVMQHESTRFGRWVVCGLMVFSAGCGTTRWTDTQRTATEQLLISDSMDRAVSKLDFRALAGREVYLDGTPISGVTDQAYLLSVVRQQMLAAGCVLREKREAADYVVEVRAGAVGTDRSDLMLGVPAVQLPSVTTLASVPSSIPELPLAKKTEQRGVTKIAVFAYNRVTGRPVWQSGTRLVVCDAKDIWVAGAGPFQRGTIYKGTKLAGDKLAIPLVALGEDSRGARSVAAAEEAYFLEPPPDRARGGTKSETQSNSETAHDDKSDGVIPATHTAPAPSSERGAANQPVENASPLKPSSGTVPAKEPSARPVGAFLQALLPAKAAGTKRGFGLLSPSSDPDRLLRPPGVDELPRFDP